MDFIIDKKRMLHAIDQLPDDATVLDAIDRLLLLYKIQKGLKERGGIPQEEIEREFLERRENRDSDEIKKSGTDRESKQDD